MSAIMLQNSSGLSVVTTYFVLVVDYSLTWAHGVPKLVPVDAQWDA